MTAHHAAAFLAIAVISVSCRRASPSATVEPIALAAPDAEAEPADVLAGSGDGLAGAGDATADAVPADSVAQTAPAIGGLWVVDAAGVPVGVLVQRGHPSVSGGGPPDILRDGVLVYSPKAGVFFGLQTSTGKVVAPRLGVSDGTCNEPIVAGYYTASDAVSGPAFAFVHKGAWFRIKDHAPLQLVNCGGTVADGVDAACAPHSGSCRGFPVQAFAAPLPIAFPAPLAYAWLSN